MCVVDYSSFSVEEIGTPLYLPNDDAKSCFGLMFGSEFVSGNTRSRKHTGLAFSTHLPRGHVDGIVGKSFDWRTRTLHAL